MSYPEQLANSVLEKSNFEYVNEYHFYSYFIDFAIPSHKIAIEIDGQQHNKEERKIMDIKKDDLLKKHGWTVHRIKWPTDNIIQSLKTILASIPSL